MKVGYLFCSDGKTSTFTKEAVAVLKDPKCSKPYMKIISGVQFAENYNDLNKRFEIKMLDKKTRLMELKLSKLRVIHFLYKDNIFVYLGIFVKRTQKTPLEEKEKNNRRIKKYLEGIKED